MLVFVLELDLTQPIGTQRGSNDGPFARACRPSHRPCLLLAALASVPHFLHGVLAEETWRKPGLPAAQYWVRIPE
jgi:hypothetical protein